MKPGTSWRNSSGIPYASQRLMKRAALSAESFSRMPPSCFGCDATIPIGRPPIRAKHVMIVFANCGFMSKYSPSSTIRRMISYMSCGFRFDSGSTSRRSSSMRSIGSDTGRRGGASSQFDGMNER